MKPPSLPAAGRTGGREKTLRWAWLLSLGSPLAAGYAAYVGTSEVLFADLVRSISESLAILTSWLSYRAVRRRRAVADSQYVSQLYTRAALAIAAAMLTSAGLIVVAALASLRNPQQVSRLWVGIVVAVGGVAYNVWFWRRNLMIERQGGGSLFGSQWRFYRTKTVTNLTVLVSLVLSSLLSRHAWSAYIDIGGSLAVAGFLAAAGISAGRRAITGTS